MARFTGTLVEEKEPRFGGTRIPDAQAARIAEGRTSPILGEQEEAKFQEWYGGHAEKLGLNQDPDDVQQKYDYRSAFKEGIEPDAEGHFDSRFKDSDHPNRYVDGVDTISGEQVETPPQPELTRTRGNIEGKADPFINEIDDWMARSVSEEPAGDALTKPGYDPGISPIGDAVRSMLAQIQGYAATTDRALLQFVDQAVRGIPLRIGSALLRGAERVAGRQLIDRPEGPGEIRAPGVIASLARFGPWEIEEEGEEAYQRDIESVYQEFGLPGRIAQVLTGASWRTAIDLIMIRGITGALPGGATSASTAWGKAAKQTIRHAARVAAWTYAKTPGTHEERIHAAALTFAYVATPAISTGASRDVLAVLIDTALNMGITVGTGQWKEAYIQARELAESEGKVWGDLPGTERAWFIAAFITPAVVSDILFASRTRAAQRGATPAQQRILKNPELQAIADKVEALRLPSDAEKEAPNVQADRVLSRLRRGEMDIPEVQAFLNANAVGSWKVVQFDPERGSVPESGVEIPFPLVVRGGGVGGQGVRAYVLPVPTVTGRPAEAPEKELRLTPEEEISREALRIGRKETPEALFARAQPDDETEVPTVTEKPVPTRAPRRTGRKTEVVFDPKPRQAQAERFFRGVKEVGTAIANETGVLGPGKAPGGRGDIRGFLDEPVLFVSSTRDFASAFAGRGEVFEIEAREDARILRQGTPEWDSIATRAGGPLEGRGEKLLQRAADIVNIAREEGFDAVKFSNERNFGVLILDGSAFRIPGRTPTVTEKPVPARAPRRVEGRRFGASVPEEPVRNLHDVVKELGGIRDEKGGVYRDELRDVTRDLKRKDGRPPDLMQRALEEEGFFFESTSEMIESFKLPRSERGRVKVSEAAYYRDLEAQEKAWFDDNEVALGQWETLRDRMLPKDFLMRDEAEQAEILTGLQDATARLLLEHPGLTQTVSVKDMTGARHTNVIPSERFSQYAQNSNRDRLGLLSGRVPTAAEQMTPEPLLGPVRPTPEAMIRKLKLVRDAIGIQAEERQELKLVDLANGLQAATERMARIQNLTPENAADMVDFMTKPPSEGGVKGVGPSTANLVKSIIRAPVTNPDEALKFANDWRMAQGKELIEPIKAPEKPPVFDIEAPENAEMKAEILTEMESVRSRLDAPHGEAAQFAEQSVLRYQNYPLPADSTARANQLARLRSIFLSSYQNVKAPETALGAKARKLLNYAMGAASMRPLVSYNAERIGDPTLLENYTRLVDSAAEAKYDIGVIRYKSLFDEAKVPEWELAMRPNIEDALITLVGTDPRSVGAEDSIRTAEQSLVDYTRPSEAWKLIERLSKLERRDPKTAEITKRIKDMEIPFSDKKNRYRKLFDNVVAELRGPTAVNVRMNQLHKWRRNWEKHGSAIMDLQSRLAQPDLDTRERQQLRSKLQKRLSIMELASPIMTDEAGEPRSVPLETMKIASDILDTQGTQALRVHLAKSTAGTRRHYWMSEDSPDEGSFLPNVEANELVFAEGGGRASTVGVPGETRPRFTATKLARGNFSGRLFQQMMRMELRARTNPHSEAILRTLFKNRNDIDDSHFKELEQMVFNAAGRGQFAGPAEIPRAVTRWFWKFYPWDISRLIWYSSRNRFQNFAIGPSQVGAANFWKSANRISALKRNPATLHRQAHDEVFERLISERQNLVREFMMQREAAERGKIPSGEVAKIASKLEDIGSQLLPWSDTANRSEMWSISYDTAERHLTSFLKGEITQGDMEKKILMDNMPPAESILLAKLFDQGRQAGGQRLDYEPFVRHYAQLKNLFTNFAYRNIGRSGWEQWIWTRPVMGLIVWPRGAFEAFYRSGLRPIVDGYKTNNPTKVWQGMNTVGLFLFQMYLAGVGHGLLFGMKRRGEDASPAYHPLNFTGYSPQGIGLQFIMDSFSFLGRLLSADQEDLADIMEGYAETASHMLPALPTIARAYEAANDVQKAGNVRWLIERARFGTDFAEPADREEPQLIPDDWFEKLPDEFVDVVNWAEKARHILVGTETPTFTELWGAPAHLPFTEIGREE